MTMEFENEISFKEDLQKVIEIFENQGYVTRKDIKNLDIRPYGRAIYDHLSEMYENTLSIEPANDDGSDYSIIIFDTTRMTSDEAEQYMKDNVLST